MNSSPQIWGSVPEWGHSKALEFGAAVKEELQLEDPSDEKLPENCSGGGELNDPEPWGLSHLGFNK